MLAEPDDIFKHELDSDKAQIHILDLMIKNNALLKMILARVSENDRPNQLIAEYESHVAELYAKIFPQLDPDITKDLEI